MRRGAVALSLLLAACGEGQESARTASLGKPLASATVGELVPEGTAPRGTAARLAALAEPGPQPSPALLERGREGYDIFCTPCHGGAGHGDGIVTRHGYPNPPSFHAGAHGAWAPSHIVAVVTQGYGKMLPMTERIAPEDRWAIAYYVKALQLSQVGAASSPGAEGR